MLHISRGRSRVSGQGYHMYKGVCVCMCVCVGGGGGSPCRLYLIFLKYPMNMKNLVSLRPNYFIFIDLKTRGGGRRFAQLPDPPLDPPLFLCGCTPLTKFTTERLQMTVTSYTYSYLSCWRHRMMLMYFEHIFSLSLGKLR